MCAISVLESSFESRKMCNAMKSLGFSFLQQQQLGISRIDRRFVKVTGRALGDVSLGKSDELRHPPDVTLTHTPVDMFVRVRERIKYINTRCDEMRKRCLRRDRWQVTYLYVCEMCWIIIARWNGPHMKCETWLCFTP